MVFGMGVGGEEKVQGLKGNGGKRIDRRDKRRKDTTNLLCVSQFNVIRSFGKLQDNRNLL